MKKLFIALFAFVAVFVLAGVASATDIGGSPFESMETDFDGGNTYTITENDGYLDFYKEVSGVVTKYDNVISQSGLSNVKGVVKVGTTVEVYYLVNRIIAPGVIDLYKAVINISDGSVASNAAYLSDFGGFVAVTQDIPSGATHPAIVRIDKTSGTIYVDIDGVEQATTSNGGNLETTGQIIAAYADPATQVVSFVYKDVVTSDFSINNYDYNSDTNDKYTIDATLLPTDSDKVYVVGIDSTYDKGIVAFENPTDSDIYVSTYGGATYSSNTILSRTQDTISMAATMEGTNVAVVYSQGGDYSDAVRAVVSNETGSSIVRADQDIDTTYTAYGIVNAGVNGSSLLSTMVEASSAAIGSLDLYEYSGSGTTYTSLNFEQQEGGGSSVPELPGNALWKVLIAVLALGFVVGIAAFMRKKKKA